MTPLPWEFALRYTQDDVVNDADKRQKFFSEVVEWESKFLQGAGVHPSGLTRDGCEKDGRPRDWSAASKEALHLCLLAKRISSPNGMCEKLMTYADAIVALKKKAACYARFRREFPDWHGYLPWFHSDSLRPLSDWIDRFPVLDNGQLAWALYTLVKALEQAGELELGEQFGAHLEDMARHAVVVAYMGSGRIADIVRVRQGQYEHVGESHDPFEQELFALFLDLFGDFTKAGYTDPKVERSRIWQNVRRHARIKRAELKLQTGVRIEVCAGWHFSSHEVWKFLQAPYRLVESAARVLRHGELARTHFSAARGVPGLCASCSSPAGNYADDVGIAEGISDLAESKTHIVTPYAAFGTLLVDEAAGAAWLRAMLCGAGMQSPNGSMESKLIDGSAICELMTWDAKATYLLAILGGCDHLVHPLRADGHWARFSKILDHLYKDKFAPPLLGEELTLALPVKDLP